MRRYGYKIHAIVCVFLLLAILIFAIILPPTDERLFCFGAAPWIRLILLCVAALLVLFIVFSLKLTRQLEEQREDINKLRSLIDRAANPLDPPVFSDKKRFKEYGE